MEKFAANLRRVFPEDRAAEIYAACEDGEALAATPIDTFVTSLVASG